MAKEFKRYLVTSALPYANGPVHIGHLAGVYIPSDIYTRYLRLKGCDVISVCGSDEHGVPITIKARKEGVTPQQIVDRYHALIKKSFEGLGMSFDIYSRTSSETHAETASAFFRKLYDEGKFIEKTSMQYYDEEAQTFLADRYIVGTCPKCGNDRAYGDQCEKCGSTLSPDELIEPHSAVSGSVPVKRETKHWYLPLDRYEEFLRQRSGTRTFTGNARVGSTEGFNRVPSAATSTGAFRFPWRAPRARCSMCGSMHRSVIYLLQRTLRPNGRNTGSRRTPRWCTSSARTTSCSTASCSPRC